MINIFSNESSFEMNVLGKSGEPDFGNQWLMIKVSVKHRGEKFSASGPWLTLQELENLCFFFKKISTENKDMHLDFIEPNLAFEFLNNEQYLSIRLALETSPPWMHEGEFLKFSFPKSEGLIYSNLLAKKTIELLDLRFYSR